MNTKKISMNVQQIMEDVMLMQFVQTHLEVIHVLVNQNMQGPVFLVLVINLIFVI